MGAAHCADEQPHALHDIAVTEEAHVEPAVEHGSMWSNLERAAKRASVRYSDHEHSSALHAGHAVRRDLSSAVSEELTQGGVDVNSVTFEKTDAIARLEHGTIESKSAAIQKVIAISQTHINSRCLSAHHEIGDLFRGVSIHAERFGEVVSRPGWDDGKATLGARLENRIRNAAASSVTADRDDSLHTVAHGLPGETFFVAGRRGFVNIIDPMSRENGAHKWKRCAHCSAAGGGINDQACRSNQCPVASLHFVRCNSPHCKRSIHPALR